MNSRFYQVFWALVFLVVSATGLRAQNIVTIGTGTVTVSNTTYPSPYGNFYWGARHQFLILASEISAAGGAPGFISSVSFDVATIAGTPLTDFVVRIGATTATDLNTTAGFIGPLTTVHTSPTYTEVAGWNAHPFTTNFLWDGTSNIIIETCFNNTAWTTNAVMNMSTTTFNSSMWYREDAAGVCANAAITGTSLNRPNMRLSMLPLTGRDARIQSMLSPVTLVVGANTITSRVQSTAADPIASVDIAYQLNNDPPVVQNNVSITPPLTAGQSYDHTFIAPLNIPSVGTYTIRTWVSNANGLGADTNPANDTLTRTLCTGLNGTYLVGGSGAAYASIQDAVNALNQCGITGPVTFQINPGTYYGSYTISNVLGSSSGNQITFIGVTGLAADVILIHDTNAAVTNKNIFTIENTPGVTFNGLTFRRTQNSTASVFGNIVSNNGNNITVVSSVFEDLTPSSSTPFASHGIRINNGSSCLISGNTLSGFSNSIVITGPTANSNYEEFNTVSNNTINNYRTGIRVENQASANVSENVVNNSLSTFDYGINIIRVVGLTLNANRVLGNVASGGILISNANDSLGMVNRVVNNVVSGSANTTGVVYGILASGSFSATATNPVNGLDRVEMLHNTINLAISTTSTTAYGLIHVTGGTTTTPAWSGISMINNQMVGTAVGSGIGTNAVAAFFAHDSIVGVLSSNYNNFFLVDANGTALVNNLIRNSTGPVLFPTVAAWNTASGQDANSSSLNPSFLGPNMPIPTNTAMNNTGLPLASVTLDAAGVTRNNTTPDIGAYEFTPAPFDLAVANIIISGSCSGPNQPVVVRLRNVGTSTWNFATNNATVTVNVAGPSTNPPFVLVVNTDTLAVGGERNFTVTSAADFTLGGNYNLNAEVSSTNDGNALNNTSSRSIAVIAPINPPYNEVFNGTAMPTNVVTNMTWNANTGLAQSGGVRFNVWSANTANMRSPIIGPLDTAAVFDFDYKITNWSGWSWPGTATTLGASDTIWIEMSNNCGTSFFTIDSILGANHIATNNFTTKRVNLGAFAGQQVIMRVRFRQFSGIDVWFDLDNFRLFTPSPVDMGILSILSPNDGCGLSGNDTVRVRVVNYGTVSQSNIPVAYTVNGGAPVNAVIPTTMMPGDSLTYVFSTPANLSAVGSYNLTAYTGAGNDGDVTNDTSRRLVRNYPVVSSLPYLENFEGAATGWFSGGAQSSWALGTPSASIINSAASGTNAWATNLSGNFNLGENSWVQSPCINLAGPNLVSPVLRFKLWYEAGQFDAGANVQFSTNGGQTWQTLGSQGTGIQNWYNNGFVANSGTPAQPGWSGNTGNTTLPGSGGYITVAHSLTPLIGQSSVIFRVRFYSSTFATLRNGIAFDDFEVFQPLDPVITSLDTLAGNCAVGPRNVTTSIFRFSPITSATLHYRLSATAPVATAPMTFVQATNRWTGTIPASAPNAVVSYFVIAVDSAGLADTSWTLSYIDDYLQPNAGPDQTILAGNNAQLVGVGARFNGQIGTGTLTNTTTTYPAPYGQFYWGARHQFLVLASELIAAGVTPGPLSSLAFNVTAPGGAPLQNFSIKLGTTSVADLTTWQNAPTTVFSAASYTDTVGWNVHPFSTAYNWDGVSNLVVEVCFNNTSFTTNAVVEQSATTFNSSLWYRADAAGVCGNNLVTQFGQQRPNIRFAGGFPFEWRNLTTNAVISTTSPTITVTPAATTSYALALNDGVCNKADTVTVFVTLPMPDLGVTQIITHNTPQLNQPQAVTVVVRNHSTVATATNFDVAFRVNGVEINAAAVTRTMQPQDTMHHTFALSWTPTAGGRHEICAFTRFIDDPNKANDTTCVSFLGVNVQERNDLISKVYPNPASQFVMFDFANQQGVGTLEIRDQLGKLVYTSRVDLSAGTQHEVKTESLASGIYNFRFINMDKVQNGQVIIRR